MTFDELKNMWIEDLLIDYPKSQDFLEENDILCVKCGAPVWGTLHENISKKLVIENDTNILINKLLDFLEG